MANGGRTRQRIRKRWGLEEVLKTGPETSMDEKHEVLRRASWLPRDFLESMAYLHACAAQEVSRHSIPA